MLCQIRKVQSFTFPLILRKFSEDVPPIDPSKNYYKILNIPKKAELAEIKKSYY